MTYRFIWNNAVEKFVRAIVFDNKNWYVGAQLPSTVLEDFVLNIMNLMCDKCRLYTIEVGNGVFAGAFILKYSVADVSVIRIITREPYSDANNIAEIQAQINTFVTRLPKPLN